MNGLVILTWTGTGIEKKWKNINAVFFEIVLTSLTRKTSQGKRRPGLPRDRLCRSNGERLEPELSQTSQNASIRRCHPPPPFFFIPLPPSQTKLACTTGFLKANLQPLASPFSLSTGITLSHGGRWADYNAEMNVALPQTTEPIANRKFCSVQGRTCTFGWIFGKMCHYFSTLAPGRGPFPSKFPKFGLQTLPINQNRENTIREISAKPCGFWSGCQEIAVFVPDNNHTRQENNGGVGFFIYCGNARTPRFWSGCQEIAVPTESTWTDYLFRSHICTHCRSLNLAIALVVKCNNIVQKNPLSSETLYVPLARWSHSERCLSSEL